jgi:hypothetical protein
MPPKNTTSKKEESNRAMTPQPRSSGGFGRLFSPSYVKHIERVRGAYKQKASPARSTLFLGDFFSTNRSQSKSPGLVSKTAKPIAKLFSIDSQQKRKDSGSSGEVEARIRKKISTVSCEVKLKEGVSTEPEVSFTFHDERFNTHIDHQGRHISSYSLILQTIMTNIDANNLRDAEEIISNMCSVFLKNNDSIGETQSELSFPFEKNFAESELTELKQLKGQSSRKYLDFFFSKLSQEYRFLNFEQYIKQQLKSWSVYQRAVMVKDLANEFLEKIQKQHAVTYSKYRVDSPKSNEGNIVKYSIYTLYAFNILLACQSEKKFKPITDSLSKQSNDSVIKSGMVRLCSHLYDKKIQDVSGSFDYQLISGLTDSDLSKIETQNISVGFVATLMANLFDYKHEMHFKYEAATKSARENFVEKIKSTLPPNGFDIYNENYKKGIIEFTVRLKSTLLVDKFIEHIQLIKLAFPELKAYFSDSDFMVKFCEKIIFDGGWSTAEIFGQFTSNKTSIGKKSGVVHSEWLMQQVKETTENTLYSENKH